VLGLLPCTEVPIANELHLISLCQLLKVKTLHLGFHTLLLSFTVHTRRPARSYLSPLVWHVHKRKSCSPPSFLQGSLGISASFNPHFSFPRIIRESVKRSLSVPLSNLETLETIGLRPAFSASESSSAHHVSERHSALVLDRSGASSQSLFYEQK